MQKSYKKYFAIFLLPTLIAFTIAFLAPFIMGVYLSFTKFTTVTDSTFIGFGNYIKIFTDGADFVRALWFTTRFAFVTVISINVIAFGLALLLTRGLRSTNFFRTVFFVPNLIGGIVLGYIWQILINGVLLQFGVDITFDAKYGFWGLVILVNWQLAGYMMVIYIAGIQNIPSDIMEAAAIDGASSLQTLRKITLPMMMPAITICTFLTLTNSFKLFDQNLALTGGAPNNETTMLALNIYKAFYGRVGYTGVGQAQAVLFFLMVGAIALIQLGITRRREVEN